MTSYVKRYVGKWRFRNNRFVFRRHVVKWLEKNGAVQLKDHPIKWIWKVETIAKTAYVIFPNFYRNLYFLIVKFEDPFMAVQVEPMVDYERKELIFTFPYIETGQPYSAARRFIRQFKKFLKEDEKHST